MQDQLQAGLLNSLTGEALAVAPGYWHGTLSELALLSTTGITGAEITARKAEGLPRLLTASGDQVNGGKPADLNANRSTPARSIAHLKLTGLMLASDFLFYRGVNHLTAALLAAEQNPNVSGVLLEVNSGGGQGTAGDMVKSTLASMKKPVVVLTHYMASAALLGTLPAFKIVASSQGVQVGSIGTYVQISTAALQNEKRNYQTIYAKQSTAKNKNHRAALDGDFKPYQELVDKFNGLFIQNVRQYRRLSVNVTETLSGDMFFAKDAQLRGLVDHVGTFSDAVKMLSAEIVRRGVVKGRAARPVATRKPTPPPVPNAARPWLNNPTNQKVIANQLKVEYDPKVLREAPPKPTTAAGKKTAERKTPPPMVNNKPNFYR